MIKADPMYFSTPRAGPS